VFELHLAKFVFTNLFLDFVTKYT